MYLCPIQIQLPSCSPVLPWPLALDVTPLCCCPVHPFGKQPRLSTIEKQGRLFLFLMKQSYEHQPLHTNGGYVSFAYALGGHLCS